MSAKLKMSSPGSYILRACKEICAVSAAAPNITAQSAGPYGSTTCGQNDF